MPCRAIKCRVDCVMKNTCGKAATMLLCLQVLAIGDKALSEGRCMWSVDSGKYNVCFFPCHRYSRSFTRSTTCNASCFAP